MAVVEAVDQLSLDREPDPRLFAMLVGVLRTIADAPAALNVAAFFWKVLAAAGLSPVLDGCVRCGEAGDDVQLVSFDLDEGGVLCRSCRSGTTVSPAALAVMRDILGGRLRDALALAESPVTHEVSAPARSPPCSSCCATSRRAAASTCTRRPTLRSAGPTTAVPGGRGDSAARTTGCPAAASTPAIARRCGAPWSPRAPGSRSTGGRRADGPDDASVRV
jgi:hypothetical protein